MLVPHLLLTTWYLLIMVKRGSTTFSATNLKVAKAGLVASAAVQKIMDLEKGKFPSCVTMCPFYRSGIMC